uniref:Uncharacterized protein n=1 Tax=Acrobeloides nanus TaxID=290746 RepID=A0A914DME5_9BILA
MEQAFYLCLMPAWCSGGCGSWPDALSILTGMTKCIQNNNISSPYPTSGSPTQNNPIFANAVAEGMADNCSLLNSSCTIWTFTKPNNPKYPGNWWSQECGANNPYIFGCDSCSGGTYNYTGTLNSCANYTATLAARVVQAENDSLCGTSSTACNGTNCPYSWNPGCNGNEYQNFVCSILNCNQTSTTTIMHTTTGFDTTTELTTKDASTTDPTSTILSSTLATTTVAPTTTIAATTTMEITTAPPTTTLSSTTTIAATTATSTMSSMTPTTITTTLSSTTLSTTTASPTSTTSSPSSTASSSSTSTSTASTSTSSSTTTSTTTNNASTSALSSSTSTSATSITSATVESSTTSSTATTAPSSSISTPSSTITSTTSTSSSTFATSTTSTATIASSTMSTPTQVLSTSKKSTTTQTLSTITNGATATSITKPTTPVVSSTYQSPATANSLATFTAHTTMTSPTTLTTTPTPTTTPLKNTVLSSSSTTISSTNQSTTATALSSTTMSLAVAATSESPTINNSALSSSAATISPQSTSTALGVTTASINTKQVFSTQVNPSSNTNSTWTNSSPIAEITLTTSKVFIISTNTTSLSSLTPLGSKASWSTTPITFNSSNLISTSIASLGTTMINNHGLTNFVTTSSINVPNSSGTPSTTSQYVANSGISSTDSEAGISSPNPNDLLTFNSGSTKIVTSDVTESLDSRRPNTRNDLLTTNLAVVTNIGNDVSSRTTTMFDQDQELTTDSENSVQPKTNSDLYTEADKFGQITSRDSYFTNQQRSTRMFDPYSTLARNTANGFDNTSLGQERDVTTMSSNKNSANSNGSPISSQTTTNSNSNDKTAHSSFDPEDGLFTSTHPQTRSNENDSTTDIFENASSTNENGKSQFGMLTTSQNTQELTHSKNSIDFVTSSPRFPNNQTFSGSTNFSRNMNSSFTSSTPIFFDWSTSSFSKNGNTSINTSSTYGIGVTVNSNQNQTNQDSTLFPITTTTSATNYSLKNLGFAITCPLCFNISNLTQTQTAQLDQLSSLYGLDPDSSQVTIDANFQEALNYVSASMPESEREECGYSLTDLVQSCVIAGNPCNLAEDFALTFDVDYGNCYTFNYQYPDIKYNTTRSGAPNGLRMLVMSEVSDYLTSTSEAGIKITLHPQDCYPYPNVEGYKFGVGVMAGIYVSY